VVVEVISPIVVQTCGRGHAYRRRRTEAPRSASSDQSFRKRALRVRWEEQEGNTSAKGRCLSSKARLARS
jgi:hypothetical protein